MLIIASALIIIIGLAHSWLGEKKLIQPVMGLEVFPALLGSPETAKSTLRVSWHLLTLCWWAVAGLLFYYANSNLPAPIPLLWMITGVFSISGLAALYFSRGKHKSWVIFFAVASITGWMAWMG